MLTSVSAMMTAALLALSQGAVQDTETAAADDSGIDASNRIVCHRFPPPAGSRIGSRRICRTQAQWDDYQGELRQHLDETFNRSKAWTNN